MNDGTLQQMLRYERTLMPHGRPVGIMLEEPAFFIPNYEISMFYRRGYDERKEIVKKDKRNYA
jgi:hypothetical protein